MSTLLLYLQINPMTLHTEDHLGDFHHEGQLPLPAVHLLVKGFDKPRGLHCGQNNLVVLQSLENLVCSPVGKERDNQTRMLMNVSDGFKLLVIPAQFLSMGPVL